MAQSAAYMYVVPDSGPVCPAVVAAPLGNRDLPFCRTAGDTAEGPAALLRNLLGTGASAASRANLERLVMAGLNLEQAVDLIADRVGAWLDENRFVMLLGGEHTVSLGAVLAHARRESRFGVLFLDAHPDLRSGDNKRKISHATVARRIFETGVNVVGVGWRSFSPLEYEYWRRAEMVVVRPEEVSRPGWVDRVIDALPPKVYLSLDLDILDPSFMPAVNTPAPGGLSPERIEELIDRLFASRRVIGADVVELAPTPGLPGPNLIAAEITDRIMELSLN